MKIVLFETEPWEQEAFRELEKEHDVDFVAVPLGTTAENIALFAQGREQNVVTVS